jgi:tetratricopeptide (TPR) repeat protein
MTELTTTINERAAEEYHRKGLDAEKSGNYEKAMEFYERALNENPDHEDTCFRLAVLYDRQADDTQARRLSNGLCGEESCRERIYFQKYLLFRLRLNRFDAGAGVWLFYRPCPRR